MISEKGIEFASLINYFEELDNLTPKAGFGEKVHKKSYIYGDKSDVKNFKKEKYKDIAIRSSIKKAIRRGHENLDVDDLKSFERQSKGTAYIIYGLDASGSMRGSKIEMAKKAGIALAYKAMQAKDKVGLIVFGSEIKEFFEPTSNFPLLLKEITKARASKETNIAMTIKKAVELFPNKDVTKHLVLLTDVMPTSGNNPEKETMDAVSEAANSSITISIVGIDLERDGRKLGQKITELGKGRFYLAKDLKEIDKIMLQDYYEFS
jgi:Mg-chelatase subunit ChlD